MYNADCVDFIMGNRMEHTEKEEDEMSKYNVGEWVTINTRARVVRVESDYEGKIFYKLERPACMDDGHELITIFIAEMDI